MTIDVEKRMREALDAQHMPAGLAERTLAMIEEKRAQEEEASEDAAAAQAGGVSLQAQAAEALDAAPRAEASLADAAGTRGPTAAATPARRRARLPFRKTRMLAALAACLVLVALGAGGAAWALLPSAYVAIDVNPSLELGINRIDRVASTEAFNDDGAAVLEAADVAGMTYEDAMDAIDDALDTYRSENSAVRVTIVCDDEARASSLEAVGTHCLDRDGTGSVTCSHASEEEHHAAHDAGLGLGKYRVYQQLLDAGVAITADEANAMTMRELLDLAANSGVSVSGGGEHSGEGHGYRHGNGNSTGSSDEDGTADGNGKQHRGSEHQGQGSQQQGNGSDGGSRAQAQGHQGSHAAEHQGMGQQALQQGTAAGYNGQSGHGTGYGAGAGAGTGSHSHRGA